jgi:hypothetical protein
LRPDALRTTAFAPALPSPSPHAAPPSGSAPPHVGLPWKAGRFSGQDFALQPDGTLRCRPEADPARTAPRSRWELARRLWGQHSPLSSLSLTRAVPVEWQCHCKAAAGQCEARIPFVLEKRLSSGRTGAADDIGEPVCNWCVINISRSGRRRVHRARAARDRRSFRGRSGHTDLFSWAERLRRNASLSANGQVNKTTGHSSRRHGSRHHHLHAHLRATISHWRLHRGIDNKKNILPSVDEVYMLWKLVYNAIAGRQCRAPFYFRQNLCHNLKNYFFIFL